MKRTLSAVVLALIAGVYLGMTYVLGPIGALGALLELVGYTTGALGILFLLFLCWILVSNWRSEEVDDVEAARRAYADGDIPLSELERRTDVALDPEAQRLRTLVENVEGVGPETSATIAAEFMTIEALEDASPEELEKLYGIGPNTAYAIHRRFNYETPPTRTAETVDPVTDTETDS